MWHTESYILSTRLFLHLLGMIYFIAISALFIQFRGLIGDKGILPLDEYKRFLFKRFGKKAYQRIPMIFWLGEGNAFIGMIFGIGLLASIFLSLGYLQSLAIFVLIVVYISIIYGGQDFLSFGWELFLIEVSAHAFFLSLSEIPNPLVFISLNLLIFRFHFEAGAVKFESRDPNWKNLTALSYHYQTQPIPNTQAWYAYKLPLTFHKFSCVWMFFLEMVVPFGIFLNDWVRFGTFLLLFSLQLTIWFTGNFSYLNHLTSVVLVVLISNRFLEPFFGMPIVTETSLPMNILLYAAGTLLFFIQIAQFYNHFFHNSTLQYLLNPFHKLFMANRYGIFAVMTTKRYEIIVEGSDDRENWREYTFYYKPSEVTRRPTRVSPYQPRVDWQIWFLPFSSFESEYWFQRFLTRLLEGEEAVLKLICYNPFKDKPPRYIRALAYDYIFSDEKTKKETKAWWKRVYAGAYSPVLTLKKPDDL